MKTKQKISLLVIAILIFISLGFFYVKQINTVNAADGFCSGIPEKCDYPILNACEDHCGCSWDSDLSVCVVGNCSDCGGQIDCIISTCIWTPIIIPVSEGGIQKVLGIIPRAPLSADSITHGPLQLKVQVYYAGDPISRAKIIANSTMFGEIELEYDPKLGEGIYVADVTIGKNVESGKQRIIYTATYADQFDEFSILVNVIPGLKINTDLNENYFKGDKIQFSGNVFDLNEIPQNKTIVSILGYQENNIFHIITDTNKDGFFSADYFIKYADPEGVWNIIIEAISSDEKSSSVKFSPKINVPKGVIYYSVNFLNPLKDSLFKRGETIPISVEVKEIDKLVENVNVVVYTPTENAIILEEVSSGIYSGNYIVTPEDTLGGWFLKAEASTDIDFKKVGGASLPIEISSTEIIFNQISPETNIIYTNSRLKIKTKLNYPDGSLVKGSIVNAFLSNDETIPLLETSDGIYEGNYLVKTKDIGTLQIEINAEDTNGNVGNFKSVFFIRKGDFITNILNYLQEVIRKYWGLILVSLIVLSFIYRRNLNIWWINIRLKKLKQEQKKIEGMQLDVEKKYYKEGSITKKEFRELRSKYEVRLAKVKENQKVYARNLVLKNK